MDNSQTPVNVGTLPLGTLAHDGPATPEQISLVLPVTGSLPDTATATVRYKESASPQWLVGHPMHRVRPAFAVPNPILGGPVQDVFAWPIIGLTPGASYDVEVTVRSGGSVNVQTLTHTTRALPAASGAPNKTANTAAGIASQLASLNPGDVLEIAAGTYNVDNLTINRSGTAAAPIYIRGASRSGTVLQDANGAILSIRASHVVLERMTLQGAGSDGGVSSPHTGISLGAAGNTRITVRNVTILGTDKGIDSTVETTQTLVYNNKLVGNNLWQLAPVNFLETNITWDDEGIKLPGQGNVAFENSISRYGDSFAYASHNSGSETNNYNIHYYRNDIRNSGDDLIEVDHGRRNVTFYDNRSHNSMNCGSLDPLYGGPYVFARNICINPYRVNTHKWNSPNTGMFLYNNTIIGTKSRGVHDPDVANWYQPNQGDQRAYGYRNNIHIYFGNGQSIWLESTGHNPIDWTHNSWYPDRQIQWGSVFGSLASAQSGLTSTTPLFSGSSKRMQNDNITESNPWTTTIGIGPGGLGTDALTEVTGTFTPTLRPGTAPKNSGVAIANITDGFGGAAPDRGAIIEGRPIPQFGDCSPS